MWMNFTNVHCYFTHYSPGAILCVTKHGGTCSNIVGEAPVDAVKSCRPGNETKPADPPTTPIPQAIKDDEADVFESG